MTGDFSALRDDDVFDVVVIGSGAAGLAAALFARLAGLSALLVERTEFLGGTTALSAGTVWVPGSRHAATVNPDDRIEAASAFLDQVVGDHAPKNLREAFLASGPAAIDLLESRSEVKFRPYPLHPDYEQSHVGATRNGRALEPLPFDGATLGADLGLLRPPIPEFTLGGMMVDRRDINHLLAATKNFRSFRHALGLFGRFAIDRLKGRRGSRLVMGNALVARFWASLRGQGAKLALRTSVDEFVIEDGALVGVMLNSAGERRRISVRRGLVLAGGGFGRNFARRREFFPQPTPEFSPAAPGATGAAQDLAIAQGARFAQNMLDNAFWAPVSTRKRRDGSLAVFPHFVLDRSKPGTLCVNRKGERFVNESASYHLFARAMMAAPAERPAHPCFLITDRIGLKKYGLGMVRMGARNIRSFVDEGYLIEGADLDDLARKIEVDAETLKASVAEINLAAVTGRDEKFGRGATLYHRVNGDAGHGPNPTLGALKDPPFYAVRLYPGDIGAANGLVIDPWARVLDGADRPLDKIYACGAEAASIMGGAYPGPGITIGPAIVMAFRAIGHISGEAAS